MNAIWLLIRALMGGLLKRAGALLGWVFDHPWQSLAAGLALWLAILQLFTVPALDAAATAARTARDKAEVALAAEIAAHLQTQQDYATAQMVAAQAAQDQRAAFETRYKGLASYADSQFAAGRASALAAADRYIADHRLPVRPSASDQAAGGPAGRSLAPAPDHSASGGDGPGAGAELVAVTPQDIQICTTNTARLIEARGWALALQAAGE